jgi:hypothetical protein
LPARHCCQTMDWLTGKSSKRKNDKSSAYKVGRPLIADLNN